MNHSFYTLRVMAGQLFVQGQKVLEQEQHEASVTLVTRAGVYTVRTASLDLAYELDGEWVDVWARPVGKLRQPHQALDTQQAAF